MEVIQLSRERAAPDVLGSSSRSALSLNIPANLMPLHEGFSTPPVINAYSHTHSFKQSPPVFKMRALQLLVLVLSGLVGAQQQALMDYLERRLLAIEVRTITLSQPDPGLQIQADMEF